MGVQTHVRSGRSLARRAGLMLAIPALALTIALGGCRAGNAHATNGGASVSQSASGASGATSTGSGGSTSNAALQQLESIDNQNQNDQQQLNSAQQNAGVNYSTQSSAIQP